MFLIKIALLTVSVASFASSAHAKVPSEAVRAVYASYLAENRVLFYIGGHLHTDRVVIWGQTALSEDMVEIILEKNPNSVGQMEALLRSTGNRWSGNYKNYQLHDFFVSEPGQTDKIFIDVVRGSQQLQLLDGYVDRVEEFDDGERFFDAKGEEVLPVEKLKGGITECAVAAGSACSLLIESLIDFDRPMPMFLEKIEKQILAYFAAHMEALEGNGIVIGEMAKALGIKSESLVARIKSLKNKLDEEHFIQRIGSEQRRVEGKYVTFYRFADAVDVVVFTPAEERILAYFEAHMEALQGNGIVLGEMADALKIENSQSLGKIISILKEKLDEGHFIQRIGREPRRVDGKRINFYRFEDADVVFTPEEELILAYFAAHMEALEGNGIVVGEMADALKMSSGSLGKMIRRLKNKLDEEHFIRRIVSKLRNVDGKSITSYRFADAVDVVVFTPAEERILAYFEEYREALQGNGIVLGEMADALKIENSQSLGKIISILKEKLDEGHFIKRIGGEPRSVDGKRIYRFADAVDVFTPAEELILAYFAAHMEALEGNGIVIGEMAKALGIKSRSLGQKISILKTKLDKEHFIKRIGREPRSGKHVYRFADTVDVLTPAEERILAYFAAHMEALEGNGIVVGEMAKALGIESGSLRERMKTLKKKLDKEHFIQRIGSERRSVDGKLVTLYRFADVVDVFTPEEKQILAYFEEHIEALEGNGIVVGEMAEALEIKSGESLGQKISILKKKLDEEHVIQRIGSKSRRVDGKTISFYRFDDAVDVVVLTPAEEGVLGYFTKHMEALQGNGIVIGEMAKVLDISGRSLGSKIRNLKKKLDEEHFIQRIGSKPRSGDSKKVYRFEDVDVVFTPAEESVLAYFEVKAHMEALQGNGIVIGEMAEALGIKSGGSLGKIITSLKEKLDEGHFIQRIGSEPRSGDSKKVYRFEDVDVEQLQIDLQGGR